MDGAMLEHKIIIHKYEAEGSVIRSLEIGLISGRPSNDALANALILGQGVDRLEIILSHGVRRSLLVVPHHMVGDDHLQGVVTELQNRWFYYRGKDGEPVLGVQAGVVAVAVDPRQLYLVTRSHLHSF